MIEFPQRLNVQNKDNFKEYNYSRVLCYLRRDIFEHMIREDENIYFDLDIFSKKYLNKNTDDLKTMTTLVMGELKKLGWSCKTSFGDTGLFIYSTDAPPPSCHPDGL
jgi:hypothetical protein